VTLIHVRVGIVQVSSMPPVNPMYVVDAPVLGITKRVKRKLVQRNCGRDKNLVLKLSVKHLMHQSALVEF